MKNINKILIVSMLFVLCASFTVFGKEGMVATVTGLGGTSEAYCYKNEDDTLTKNEWKQVWDSWYYFGEDGVSKQKTWAEIDGKWYYFDSFSRMLHDTTTPDGYTVGSDGAWVKDGQVVVETVTNN